MPGMFETRAETLLSVTRLHFGCSSSVQYIQNVLVDDALSEPERNPSSSE